MFMIPLITAAGQGLAAGGMALAGSAGAGAMSTAAMASLNAGLFGTAATAATASTAAAAATSGLIGSAGSFSALSAVQGVGTILSSVGAVGSGIAARKSADFKAAQMEDMANSERAVGQRKALEAERRAGIAISRAQAVAAASGGGALDPTVVGLMAGIAGEGEMNAQAATFSHEERARNAETSAQATRMEGDFMRTAGFVQGASNAAYGVGKMYKGSSPPPVTGGSILASQPSSLYTKFGSMDDPTYGFANRFGANRMPAYGF